MVGINNSLQYSSIRKRILAFFKMKSPADVGETTECVVAVTAPGADGGSDSDGFDFGLDDYFDVKSADVLKVIQKQLFMKMKKIQ